MSAIHLDPETVEALVLGELSPAAASEAEGHTAGCAECARELAWQRAEAALIKRRAAAAEPISPKIWAGVEQRLQAAKVVSLASRRRTFSTRLFSAGAALAAAAAIVVVMTGHHGSRVDRVVAPSAEDDQDQGDAEAAAAVDAAEKDYRTAFASLEKDVKRVEKKDPAAAKAFRATLEKARAQLDTASSAAGGDVQARLRVLAGYATTLRSFQRAADAEEAMP